MNVDASLSRYSEHPDARREFTRAERRRLLVVLRRLQFLEHKEREVEGLLNPHTEREIEALEWVLTELGFLQVA